ncbi:MAG: hypothetical protein QW569_02865 [Candidatus Bathyarchaeia archaeon]
MGEAEFLLKERRIRLRLLDNIPRLEVAGLTIEGSKGQEVEVPLWIAEEFAKSGKGEILAEEFGLKDLAKAHWREALPSSRHLSKIEDDFYFNLRRLLKRLEKESGGNLERMKALERAHSMARDIVNCRMRKLASIAASQVEGGEVVKNLALEEKFLYESMKRVLNGWIRRILEGEILGEPTGEP